ncbi:phospholipase A [Cobetia sp. L2A1]|uniref:phospholipase A n=1 Tax=Cobetia sp. L2A1 TaxID=2686360 RepID=UPI001E5E0B15|nr:phospholipase A [Cobetia sp. L2A1]
MPFRLISTGFRPATVCLSGLLATALMTFSASSSAAVPYSMDSQGRMVLANGQRFTPQELGLTPAQARAGAKENSTRRMPTYSPPPPKKSKAAEPSLVSADESDADGIQTDGTQAEGTQTEDSMAQLRAQERLSLEDNAENNPLAITAYKRNYLLPWAYNSTPNAEDFDAVTKEGDVDNSEVKYQISFKVQLMNDIFKDNGDIFFAYTQRSWWQAYNSDASSPFRETNYEPEAFIQFDNKLELLGWTNTRNRLGFAHQSNGRSDPLSRSWNRVYADMMFQNGDWAVAITPHWRIPEDSDDDDNPDLDDYIGYGDITLGYTTDQHEITWMVRGNPSKGNFGNQVDYSFPMFGKVRGYVQYYHGYGESLIDYDHSVNRFGLGFSINTFFAGLPET